MRLHSDTYDHYKKSEGEWAETVPSEWQEKRVKDLFTMVTQTAPADNDYELLSLYASIGVRPRKDLEARGNKASSTDGYWMVKKNDIVVNKLLAWMGAVGLSEYDGVTSPAYDVLRQVKPDIDPRYFSYLFRTEIAKKIFRKNSRGIMDMRLRLYFDKLGAITIPVPSYAMQKCIADYINSKISQIDTKINLLNKKSNLYRRLKDKVIHEVVTLGLDRNIELEFSDIEKIGKIPKHWKIKRFKEIFRKTHSGWTPDTKKDESYEGENVWVTIGDMNDKWIFNSGNKLSDKAVRESNISITPKGSLLFSFKLSIGKVAFAGCDLYTNEAIISIEKERKVNLKYFYYTLPILLVLNAKENIYGAQLLNQGLIFNTPLLFPPAKEQEAIADYLDDKTQEIDEVIRLINKQIEKQQELKIALINDAVVGRIKVPDNSGIKGQVA
jgi:type I restriction enzyme S subunit